MSKNRAKAERKGTEIIDLMQDYYSQKKGMSETGLELFSIVTEIYKLGYEDGFSEGFEDGAASYE